MLDILTLQAELQPDKVAVAEDRPNGPATCWTFAHLNREVNRLANAIRDLGIRPGDKIVWYGKNSPSVVRMIYAARKIGATAVPLNYRFAPEEAAYVIDDSDAVLVYADAEQVEVLSKIRPRIPKVRHVMIFDGAPGDGMIDGDALCAGTSDTEPAPPPDSGLGPTMIYTSGTTGRPKGASRRSISNPQQMMALVQMIGFQPDDVYLTSGPLYHGGPAGFMAIAHALGNTVVIQRKFDAEAWLRLVHTHRVSTTFSAPTPIRMVCGLPAEVKATYDRSSMRRMIANAAPWSITLKQQYLRDFPEDSLWEIYASTELGINTVLPPADQLRKPGSCGKPAPGVEIKLIDADGNEITDPQVPGEIYVRSDTAFDSYYKSKDKYEQSRRGDFLTVGDIAYRDDEGYYYICDRKSDLIISGGVNVYPAEVEAALDQHPRILDVAVIGIPSEQWGERVHAVIVPQPGCGLTESDVIAFARQHLAAYKIPRSVSFADEIPRTGSGKILKRLLREPFWKGHGTRVG